MGRFVPGHQEMMRTMVTRLKRMMKMMRKTTRRKTMTTMEQKDIGSFLDFPPHCC